MEWSSTDVVDWLTENELGEYASNFENINGSELLGLTKKDLKTALDIKILSDRKKIWNLLEELRGGTTPTVPHSYLESEHLNYKPLQPDLIHVPPKYHTLLSPTPATTVGEPPPADRALSLPSSRPAVQESGANPPSESSKRQHEAILLKQQQELLRITRDFPTAVGGSERGTTPPLNHFGGSSNSSRAPSGPNSRIHSNSSSASTTPTATSTGNRRSSTLGGTFDATERELEKLDEQYWAFQKKFGHGGPPPPPAHASRPPPHKHTEASTDGTFSKTWSNNTTENAHLGNLLDHMGAAPNTYSEPHGRHRSRRPSSGAGAAGAGGGGPNHVFVSSLNSTTDSNSSNGSVHNSLSEPSWPPHHPPPPPSSSNHQPPPRRRLSQAQEQDQQLSHQVFGWKEHLTTTTPSAAASAYHNNHSTNIVNSCTNNCNKISGPLSQLILQVNDKESAGRDLIEMNELGLRGFLWQLLQTSTQEVHQRVAIKALQRQQFAFLRDNRLRQQQAVQHKEQQHAEEERHRRVQDEIQRRLSGHSNVNVMYDSERNYRDRVQRDEKVGRAEIFGKADSQRSDLSPHIYYNNTTGSTYSTSGGGGLLLHKPDALSSPSFHSPSKASSKTQQEREEFLWRVNWERSRVESREHHAWLQVAKPVLVEQEEATREYIVEQESIEREAIMDRVHSGDSDNKHQQEEDLYKLYERRLRQQEQIEVLMEDEHTNRKAIELGEKNYNLSLQYHLQTLAQEKKKHDALQLKKKRQLTVLLDEEETARRHLQHALEQSVHNFFTQERQLRAQSEQKAMERMERERKLNAEQEEWEARERERRRKEERERRKREEEERERRRREVEEDETRERRKREEERERVKKEEERERRRREEERRRKEEEDRERERKVQEEREREREREESERRREEDRRRRVEEEERERERQREQERLEAAAEAKRQEEERHKREEEERRKKREEEEERRKREEDMRRKEEDDRRRRREEDERIQKHEEEERRRRDEEVMRRQREEERRRKEEEEERVKKEVEDERRMRAEEEEKKRREDERKREEEGRRREEEEERRKREEEDERRRIKEEEEREKRRRENQRREEEEERERRRKEEEVERKKRKEEEEERERRKREEEEQQQRQQNDTLYDEPQTKAEAFDDASLNEEEENELVKKADAELSGIGKRVETIRADLEITAFKKLHNEDGSINGIVHKARKAYDEFLLQQLMKVDAVESHGSTKVRGRRKQMVKEVQALLDDFDAFKKDDVVAP